ncbi:MAG: MBL fold metallo-hydrolase, partial [Terriglobales bacterium]
MLALGLAPRAAAAVPCPASAAIAALERQGLEFLNTTRADRRYRAETRGEAHALRWSARAAGAARCHSEAMARAHRLSHADPSGADPGARLSAAGVDWAGVGENVAMAADLKTADGILMKEPPFQPNHRANILNPAFTDVGVGIARSSDGLLWVTEDFFMPSVGAAPPRLTTASAPVSGRGASRTELVLLGTGSPVADPERWGPAAAVVVNGEAYLVDAGAGVVRRAVAAARNGHPELRAAKLRRVFITHLHSDHTLGYPDLILSPWVLGRKQALEAYGPAGLQAMTRNLLAAWKKDIAVRTTGLEHEDAAGVRVEVHEIAPGEVYRDANVVVTAFRVHHGSWDEAFGYAFQTADRRIVFSGDTTPVAAVSAACHGCDLLVHEVYNARGVAARESGQAAYFRAFHTSIDWRGTPRGCA